MTREAELLVDMWSTLYKEHHKVITEENYDAIKKAIKALNQEPKILGICTLKADSR
jgi:phosphoglycolate phosphatase-like HAD superfamily hydrolase